VVSDRVFSFTWLGHATFVFRTPGGKRLLLDPWLETNPSTPDSLRKVGALDLMLITHGHSDHMADALVIGRSTGVAIVAPDELGAWLERKGLRSVIRMNIGGTLRLGDLSVTMVMAEHSSSVEDEGRPLYAGAAAGYVIIFEDGLTAYFAGDTSVFGDMRLIADLYRPTIAFLPIGDLFTMGPEQAAKACELLKIKRVVPMHYGTFPALTGTPRRLRELVAPAGVEVVELAPGETKS